MRFILSTFLIFIFAAATEYIFPWWTIAVVAIIVGYAMNLSIGKAFLSGFLAIALLWLGWALWYDLPNNHLLSGRMANVFSLPNSWLFLAVTVLIGGLTGGLGGWSGSQLRKMFKH